jgi:hypothetical protein
MDIVEKRTRLPIMLLVASGVWLGVALNPAIFHWINEKLTYWAIVLPFAFLFYRGRDRLLQLLSEAENRQMIEMSKADYFYERFVHFIDLGGAVTLCAGLGAIAGYFSRDLGLNLYFSIGVGVFIFIGLVGFILSDETMLIGPP